MSEPLKVDFHYEKSAQFREIGCDGMVGGPTPQNKIWLAFYTERFALPRSVRHDLVSSDDNQTFTIDKNSPVEILEAKNGIIRNVEFGVYLSQEGAVELKLWLENQLNALAGT